MTSIPIQGSENSRAVLFDESGPVDTRRFRRRASSRLRNSDVSKKLESLAIRWRDAGRRERCLVDREVGELTPQCRDDIRVRGSDIRAIPCGRLGQVVELVDSGA
ncbi:MAG: hypothetical protein QM736_15975 [Vicinamibacterales bacterium]